jgi:hypothetical protein
MSTKTVSRFATCLIGFVLGLVALTPSANAACGPKLPAGLLPLTDHVTADAHIKAEATGIPDAAPKATDIVGLWLVNITVGGQPFAQSFEAFTTDGFEILNDNGPPQAGNVCLGIWTATGRNIIRINHPSWNFDDQGNVIGTVVIKSQISLDNGSNSYHGTFTAYVYDINNNPAGDPLVGQLTATRITP